MTLIDRYLHAVRSFLPASRQDDIIRELSDDIYSQAADREGLPTISKSVRTFMPESGSTLVAPAAASAG